MSCRFCQETSRNTETTVVPLQPIGLHVTLQTAYDLLAAADVGDVRALALLQRRELWAMPVVNPDGYVWNK